jgi:hypothetical protein
VQIACVIFACNRAAKTNIGPGQASLGAEFDFRQLRAARDPVVGSTLNLLSPSTRGLSAKPQCHGSVTTHLTHGGTRGYGTGSFSQLDGISETRGHASECLWVDWGSSGRRFKSCQPDKRKPALNSIGAGFLMS